MSDHYFSGRPQSQEVRQPVTLSVWGRALTLQSATGVFSAGRLDIGTAVLFRETEPPTRPGRYLDLGCGYGVIACALATVVTAAEVWAVDVNERALETTRVNVASHRLGDRVRVCAPDEVPADLTFDEIWSNPPIRIGKRAVHELLLTWLARLGADGRAVMVIGRNLGADSYQRWLRERGFACERIGSAKGFRVFEVRGG
jgi:16S rRNA (guanine1207-N2)-methyltransferase